MRQQTKRWLHGGVVLLAAALVLGWGRPAAAAGSYTYLPSGDVTDGRMLTIAGTNLSTLNGASIAVEIASPKDASTFELGVFDGDTSRGFILPEYGEYDAGTWDFNSIPLQYELFFDPNGDGSGTIPVPGGSWIGTNMPDNDWFSAVLPNFPQARSASGHYFYTLRVTLTTPLVTCASSFKLRTDGSLGLRPGAFSFMVPLWDMPEVAILFPEYNTTGLPTPTTYDGTWDFYLDVPKPLSEFTVWDGDLDYGAWDGSTMDTDDPDTPNDVLPDWSSASSEVHLEGVAQGLEGVDANGNPIATTGDPNDNTGYAGYGEDPFFARGASVTYEVVAPNGLTYVNANPSGNEEWEQFRIDTAPFDRSKMDYHANSLPNGIYQVHMDGMDIANLSGWRFFYSVLGVDASGDPVAPLRPNGVGVFLDLDGDGKQSAEGEPGIGSLKVELVNAAGQVVGTATTLSDGFYAFQVPVGCYIVRLAASNFAPGTLLQYAWPTTGGTQQSVCITDPTRPISLDFGFYVPPANPPLPSNDFGTPGFWKNWNNHFGPEFVDRLLNVIQRNSTVFGTGRLFGPVSSANLAAFMDPSKKSKQAQAGIQLLSAWLNTMNGSMPMAYTVRLKGADATLYGAALWPTRTFMLRSEQLVVNPLYAAQLVNILSALNGTPR